MASKIVRPGQIYRVAVTVFQTQTQTQEIEVRASLLRNGVDMGSDTKICQPNMPETLMIRVTFEIMFVINFCLTCVCKFRFQELALMEIIASEWKGMIMDWLGEQLLLMRRS